MGARGSQQTLVLGRYSLFQEIASGGMATVHIGRLGGPAGFSRTVAIKRMHPHLAKEPDFVAMFVDEARLAARIQHPNVVSTLDIVSTNGELFLVMEYVRGESLARLERAVHKAGVGIPPAIASAIVVGVLQGLHAAHEARNELGQPLGLVHRDVTLQNVLVGVDGTARVLDFGVAKAVGRLHTTREGQIKGKLASMSPEQISGENVTRTTDVYAAGVLLWETLTGTRLFAGATDGETLNRILSSRVKPPSECNPAAPRALDPIVLRAVERDPDLRFRTAKEMALAIQAACPPAPASEVGDWVERWAGEALARRDEFVTEVESATSQPGGRDSDVSIGSSSAAIAALKGEAVEGRPSTPRATMAARRRWLFGLGGVAIAVAIVVFLVVLARSDRAGVSVANAAPSSPLIAPAVASSIAASTPSSNASAATSASPNVLASASSSPASTATPTSGTAHSSRKERHRPPASSAKPQCDPPWYLDGTGAKKWKPECR